MADYTAKTSGGPFTSTTSGTVVGGRLCTASGAGTVAESTTGAHSVGITGHNAASGAKVTVIPLINVIHVTQIQDSITIAAGAPIIAGTTGFVATGTLNVVAAAGTLLGVCLTGGTGSDSTPVYATWIGTT